MIGFVFLTLFFSLFIAYRLTLEEEHQPTPLQLRSFRPMEQLKEGVYKEIYTPSGSQLTVHAAFATTTGKREVCSEVVGSFGKLLFSADTLVIEPNKEIYLIGAVKIKDSEKGDRALAEKAEIDTKNNRLILTGKEVLFVNKEASTQIVASRIIFYKKNGKMAIETEGSLRLSLSDAELKRLYEEST